MIRRSLLASTLLLLPALAWADATTTAALQRAYGQFQNLQKSTHLTPQQSASLQRDLQQMTADQVNPPLFAVDRAIFEARLQGLREAQAAANGGQEKERLSRELASLNQKYQALQAEYAQLRQQLATQTMQGARSARLKQEIQQQKEILQQEEQSLATMQPSSAPSTSSSTSVSPTVAAPAAAPAPLQALAAYGDLRQGKYGTELNMPVSALFSSDQGLSANGKQRLRAVAGTLKGISAAQILVRVSGQPGGLNLATQRAEAILQGLRQAGIPDSRLALASGAGVASGMAQILLPSGS
ncbi:hypothetical protein HFU84_04660 [Acidithiobacillus sp. CV18-2]|uniref:OmpA-like domain-containing protein n=1 Tax=Igneacidithiobacillus copahuensis TaxID=2724909 RepID=A0AAE3CIV7_9PROT|nr:hypothetical protein [Igneacidithiobacillus copahuensis]MBU2754600.1 hypothetical protein [Acidithiobacillus sp. CV18-3]MBU2757238.1 hypothetical protein [Acidithiobacillus sp. BN09-2]MBU2776807.1 hypothetical protein [Acidithiobacillus sp. CV18-2]MBU2796445.1 hypothetical protein [Acidithiobacillus sp. VAN18-2]MBU2799463.1 hypothetical protein [Acidithiobacillus sp. VAN18-4]UTV81027.1 hypothetical protein MQE22_13615 [Acidithiobacillus sp. YTS05]